MGRSLYGLSTLYVTHVILDTRLSHFSTCNIEKLGRAWGRGYIIHPSVQLSFICPCRTSCSFVRVYKDSKIGVLPVSSSGRLLQEVITATPNVTMVGVKPSNIFVTLGTKDKGWYLNVQHHVQHHVYRHGSLEGSSSTTNPTVPAQAHL